VKVWRGGIERGEKALAVASRLAASLLADLAPGEIPILWETIEPQQEDWLDLMELCEASPDAAGREFPQTAEAQMIARAVFNHTAQQAAFLLGVAIGRRLAPTTDKGG
jgi:hypothetical protein